jgi:hypothetical protein
VHEPDSSEPAWHLPPTKGLFRPPDTA